MPSRWEVALTGPRDVPVGFEVGVAGQRTSVYSLRSNRTTSV